MIKWLGLLDGLVSDDDGYYQIINLVVGVYIIVVEDVNGCYGIVIKILYVEDSDFDVELIVE